MYIDETVERYLLEDTAQKLKAGIERDMAKLFPNVNAEITKTDKGGKDGDYFIVKVFKDKGKAIGHGHFWIKNGKVSKYMPGVEGTMAYKPIADVLSKVKL